ncbi:hypothetical protein [Neptunomonas phycophila]|uniref:hypothetical protein n=1 Tax=Neptunomonas phycophila TaxID=1572645 RepID=UPI0026E47EB8|nr:hypothetical protein [Neptunomonas phycophila]
MIRNACRFRFAQSIGKRRSHLNAALSVTSKGVTVISNTVKKVIFFLPALLCLSLFVVYGLGDYWVIGVIANPEELARYNFGAEAMIAHGGDKYRSASSYAMASLVVGMLAVIGFILSLLMLFKSSKKALLKAYCGAAITLFIVVLVGHAW